MTGALAILVAAVAVALLGDLQSTAIARVRPGDADLPGSASSDRSAKGDRDTPKQRVITDLLPGVALLTEEVEPGVLRVLGDGVGHGFAFDTGDRARRVFDSIAVDRAGGVRLVSHIDDQPRSGFDQYMARLWDLGRAGAPPVSVPSSLLDIAADSDGTVWAAGEGRYLAHFDGDRWQVVRPARGYAELLGLTVGGDGSIWGAWRGPVSGPDEPGVVARFDGRDWVDVIGDEWSRYGGRTVPFKIAATSDGILWAGLGPGATLARFEGSSWTSAWPLGDEVDHAVHALAVAPDGSLWALLETFSPSEMHLAHLGAGGWSVLSGADGVPQAVSRWLQGDWLGDRGRFLEVGPDGRAWLVHEKGGVVAFDGATSTRYLADRVVRDQAVGPDGSLWAVAPDADPASADLYVIPATSGSSG